jgi:hypothetical protein
MFVGESVTGGAVPVPLRLTTCALLLALSTTLIDPLAPPVVVGLKVTLIMQEALALSEVGQLLA